jgi:hypothetical protein
MVGGGIREREREREKGARDVEFSSDGIVEEGLHVAQLGRLVARVRGEWVCDGVKKWGFGVWPRRG